MKNKFLKVLFGVATLLSLTGCKPKECEHEWKVEGTEAGHYSICEKCGEKKDEAQHTFTYVANGDKHHQKCSVCNFETAEVAHNFTAVSDGANGHHTVCECGATTEVVAHTWDEGVKTKGNILYTCTVCGENKNETVDIPVEAGVYNFDSMEAKAYASETKIKLADGLFLIPGTDSKVVVDASAKAYTPAGGEEVTSVNRLKTGGASQANGLRTFEIHMEKAGKIIAYAITGSSGDLTRHVGLFNDIAITNKGPKALFDCGDFTQGSNIEAKEMHVKDAGVYYVGAINNSVNFYAIQIIYDTCAHEFTSAKVADATCGANGSTKYTCSKCSTEIVLNDLLSTGEHNFSTDYTSNNGQHWHECTVCHTMQEEAKVDCTADPTLHHIHDEPTADNPVTYDTDTCSVCGGTWNVGDPYRYVAPVVGDTRTVFDATGWTDTKGTVLNIGTDVTFTFASENTLKGALAFADSAWSFGIKVDSGTADGKYVTVGNVKEGETVIITYNVTGGKTLTYASGGTESLTKNAEANNTVEHVVLASEATNGVKFWCSGTMYIMKIEVKAAAPKEVTLFDMTGWTDTKGTVINIGTDVTFTFDPENTLKASKCNPKIDNVATELDFAYGIKVDAGSATNKFITITNVKEGDKIVITCNATGSKNFVFADTSKLACGKNLTENNVVEHIVTAAEATDGVKMYTDGSIWIMSIVKVPA